MKRLAELGAQALAFAGFFGLVGYFSALPVYSHRDEQAAQITVSYSHTGPRIRECRVLTPQELAELAANMRSGFDCPRRRLPLLVEIEFDHEVIYRAAPEPAGIAGDGAAFVYARLTVPSGSHNVAVRMRDSRRATGFDHSRAGTVELQPRRNFTVDFRPESGGFVFR